MGRDKRLQINGLINVNGEGRSSDRPVQNAPLPVIYRFDWHGRQYYAYHGQAVYPFPIDEEENDCTDIFHALIHERALRGKLHNSDLAPQRYRRQILDVGCGTGIWCYDFARDHPDTDVIGIDLMVNQPASPDSIPNCDFRTPVDFNAAQWPFHESSFDFIRASRLCGSVSNWLNLYYNTFRYLKPGDGYMESIEIDWTPRTLGEVGPETEPLFRWWRLMEQASARHQKPIAYQENTEALLTRVGFTDINHKTVRISMQPMWQDNRDQELSEWFKGAMCRADDRGQPSRAFESLTLSLFTRQLGYDSGYVSAMCDAVKRICESRQWPLYFNLHIWTARKPMTAQRPSTNSRPRP